MSENLKCLFHNANKVYCANNKVINFCKMHKYLENKVNPENLIFCVHCNYVLTSDMSTESHENQKCTKCIKINFCQGISQKNKPCSFKALENDNYCELHQTYKKWKELEESGIKICSNWIRGCWTNIFDNKSHCADCINKPANELEIRNQFIETAIEYNNNNENKMCTGCNHIFTNEELLENDQCKKCYKNSQKNVDNYKQKDLFEEKICAYKTRAITRNLEFTLSESECYKLFSKKCYYCGYINQELGVGIDRSNNNKGYIKSNCVPCCFQCNVMKKDHDLTKFIKICQHIATINNKFDGNLDFTLFETADNPTYKSYKKGAEERNLEFKLEQNDFNSIINKKCHYCHLSNATSTYNGAGGIDRKNNLIGYVKQNCVPCCKTCNLLKHTQSHTDFVKRCSIISKYKKLNITDDIEDKLIDKLYESLDCTKRKIKPIFLHSYDYYNSRIWTGTITDVAKIKICLEFVESKDQKDIWNYYRYTVSSLETFKLDNFIGRTICVLVKDLVTRKYLGIMSLSSDIKNLKNRDDFIGWTSDNKFKNKMLNRIMNLSTCVSLQPFGFNFNGGKLLTQLAFSTEIANRFYSKFNEELLGIITTGLYGKSIQYDRLKELKFIGMTAGSSSYKISPEITKLCREYLLTVHNKVTSGISKLFVLSDALHKLKIPREYFITDNPKGIYFGYTYENSQKILCCKKTKPKKPLFRTATEIFTDWYNRWAIQRYNNLKKTSRLKELEYNCPSVRIKIFRQRQIENLGLENYKNIVSEQNKKYYEENKKQIIKKKLENYHKNKKITNNKYDDYLHLDDNINILKPELPNNFSLFKEDKYIYLQFSKLIEGEKMYCKNKISNLNIQEELNKLIDEVNIKYPDLKIKAHTVTNIDEWNNSKELKKLIIVEKAVKENNNNKIIETYEKKKTINVPTPSNGEFKLPKNISVVKTNQDYYLTFVKAVDGNRVKKMVKLTTNDFQTEFNNFIDLINNLHKDIVQFEKYTLQNIPHEYTQIVKPIKTEQVDNSNVDKPVMPANFSICSVNNVDYIQFCKKIDGQRYQYKTKINSYDLADELNKFIDDLNSKYGLNLDKSQLKIANTNGWKTTNKIVEHSDTPEKLAQRERTQRYLEKQKESIGVDEFNKQKAQYAKTYRTNKKAPAEIEV